VKADPRQFRVREQGVDDRWRLLASTGRPSALVKTRPNSLLHPGVESRCLVCRVLRKRRRHCG
jgi:hypothetical protein